MRCVLLRLRTTNLAKGVFLGRHALARHTTPKTENTENNSEIIVIVFWILENNGDGDPDHPRVYPRSRAPDPEPRARAGNGAVGEAEKIVFVFVKSNLVVSFHGTKKKKSRSS